MITENYRTVTPYLTDYKSKKAAHEAFEAGADFYLEPEHVPCSIRDFAKGVTVNVRYNQLRMVQPYKVK